jgi:hypothetical protein
MTTWTRDDLIRIDESEEWHIATRRRDGTLRKPVIVWGVRLGDDLYVRSVNGRTAAWFRGTQTRHEGRIQAGSVGTDITFVEETDPGINDEIDAAYWNKYRRYPGIVPSIVSPEARAATLKLVPPDNELLDDT